MWMPEKKGFDPEDGSIEDCLEWGEVTFVFDDKTYKTGGTPEEKLAVFDCETWKAVIEAESAEDLLEMEFCGT